MGLITKLFEPRDLSPSPKRGNDQQTLREVDDLANQFGNARLERTPSPTRGTPSAPAPSPYARASPGAVRQGGSSPIRQYYEIPSQLPAPKHGPSQPQRFPGTPPRPNYAARPQSHTTPPRPSPVASTSHSTPIKPNQCAGTTSKGARCTRVVPIAGGTPRSRAQSSPSKPSADPSPRKVPLGYNGAPLTKEALVRLDRMLSKRGKKGKQKQKDAESTSGSEQDEVALELPKFCYQHAQQAMDEPGNFAGPSGIYIVYDEWIPRDLPQETRLQLRHEMTKPVSTNEKPGYIYCLEMAPSTPSVHQTKTLIKLGRSVHPVARHGEWRRQCPSRLPICRDFYPLHPSHPLLHRSNSPYSTSQNPQSIQQHHGSRMRGSFLVNEKGAPYHHRLERLILIEAAGRAAMESSGYERTPCQDCKRVHVELFEVNTGAYEAWISEMILRWIMYCERVLNA